MNISRRYRFLAEPADCQAQKKEQARFENLVESNAANQKQLDDINAQLALLDKQLSAQIETLENNNRSVGGELLALSAQIAQIEDQIVKNCISSPIDGTILSKYAEPGELAAQGRALFKVADMENLFLRVYIAGRPVDIDEDRTARKRICR